MKIKESGRYDTDTIRWTVFAILMIVIMTLTLFTIDRRFRQVNHRLESVSTRVERLIDTIREIARNKRRNQVTVQDEPGAAAEGVETPEPEP